MKKDLLLTSYLVLVFGFFNSNTIVAQISSGGDAFLQGNYIQIGVERLGGFEGANSTPPTTGTPWRFSGRGGAGISGFVADPLMSSWTNYNGDFFTPGSPENGWGLKINGSTFGNNRTGTASIISSTSLSWTHTGTLTTVDWEGSIISGTNNIKVNLNYSLGDNDLFYITTVTVTNMSSLTTNDIYYYRNLDADNNQSLSGNFSTTQSIVAQPSSCVGCYAQVNATQAAGSGFGASYFSFLASDSIMKAGYGGFSNRDGETMYNGTGFTQTVGATNTADEAIYLAYKIDSLTAGGSHKSVTTSSDGSSRVFRFASIFAASEVTAAQNAMQAAASVGINELQNSNNSIAIYPNPFEENTTINLNPTINLSKAEFQIYDIMGKQIIALPVTTHNFTFNKGEMAQGLYFYKLVNNGSEISTGKFLVK